MLRSVLHTGVSGSAFASGACPSAMPGCSAISAPFTPMIAAPTMPSRVAPIVVTLPLKPRVRLVGVPPAIGTVHTSPLEVTRSLINPPMNATVLPSDKVIGDDSCIGGRAMSRTVPAARSIATRLALHQLASPLPVAAVATTPLPSRNQSYSYT